MEAAVRRILAPQDVLVAGINLSNFLLVTEPTVPRGVSTGMVHLLAERLGVTRIELKTYANPSLLTERSRQREFAVGLVANEPQRANNLVFSQPYAEIEATLLSRRPAHSLNDLDEADLKIAVSEGSAYDLYLTRKLKRATLVRAKGIDASYDLYKADLSITALAGLRPKLVDYPSEDGVLLENHFAAVQQAIGVPKSILQDNDDVIPFLDDFVADCLSSGAVADLVCQFGVQGRLTVAGSQNRMS